MTWLSALLTADGSADRAATYSSERPRTSVSLKSLTDSHRAGGEEEAGEEGDGKVNDAGRRMARRRCRAGFGVSEGVFGIGAESGGVDARDANV